MTRTAAMLEAYKPDEVPGHAVVCQSFLRLPDVVRWIVRAETMGLGVKVHCAGDAAVRDILDAVEIVRRLRGTERPHASHRACELYRSGRHTALQGTQCRRGFVPGDLVSLRHHGREPGRDRRARRALSRTATSMPAGALMAGGSDWPVIGLPDPWFRLEGMVTRRNPKGGYPGALGPNRPSICRPPSRFTRAIPQKAIGLGHLTGTIEVGKSADLIVLEKNLFEVGLIGFRTRKFSRPGSRAGSCMAKHSGATS